MTDSFNFKYWLALFFAVVFGVARSGEVPLDKNEMNYLASLISMSAKVYDESSKQHPDVECAEVLSTNGGYHMAKSRVKIVYKELNSGFKTLEADAKDEDEILSLLKDSLNEIGKMEKGCSDPYFIASQEMQIASQLQKIERKMLELAKKIP